jgi:membrane-anchored protein YejM (alkaline phosphatase superfamily)
MHSFLRTLWPIILDILPIWRRMKESTLLRRKLLLFSLMNAPVSMAISLPLYLYSANEGGPLGILQFAAHFLAFSLVLYVAVYLLSLITYRLIKVLAVPLFSLLQVFIFSDVKIFGLFRFHINSLVINVLTTEGAGDSVILGKGTLALFGLVILLIILSESGLYFIAFRKAGVLAGRRFALCIILCAGLIIGDKVLYAYGDLQNMSSITRAIRLYPFYQPFTVKRLFKRVLKIEVNREKDLADLPQIASQGLLHYPKRPLVLGEGARTPNIIVIALEGLRWDILNPENMPNLYAFSQREINFKRHFSGGNCSRFGIFSLFYGIQGSYWQSFLAERRSPVLMDALIARGYDFKILSSTLLTFPEFRKTVFVRVPDAIEDQFTANREKDRQLTESFLKYISERKDSSKPFFSFIFFNTSHQPYKYPPGFEKFKPVSGTEINYMKSLTRESIQPLFNRYRNSLFYDDSLLAQIIEGLEKNNLLGNSIVVITGDHGEEFFEAGIFGHASTFDDYQIRTPFVMHMPGIKPMQVERTTSHLDLVPTLMETLGYTNDPSDYSQGLPLFKEDLKRLYVTSAGWDDMCLIGEKERIIFSTESYGSTFQGMDNTNFAAIPLSASLLQKKKTDLSDALRKMSEFYR